MNKLELSKIVGVVVNVLTWIHNSFRPHLLHTQPIHFPPIIVVNGTIAVVIGIMFGLDIAVVNVVLVLNSLQRILHLLLHKPISFFLQYIHMNRQVHTSSRARIFPACITAFE